jgi:hypothetical protein
MRENARSNPTEPPISAATGSASQKLTPVAGQNGNRVRADGIKRNMAKGNLSGQADENVEPDAGDNSDPTSASTKHS